MKTGRERRIHPRIDHQLPLNVAFNEHAFTTNTQNLSCLGTYCRIDKYIPPFTRVRIKLDLPVNNEKHNVECDGVVVRSDDDADGTFDIAIYFNRIQDHSRQKLTDYVSQHVQGAYSQQ